MRFVRLQHATGRQLSGSQAVAYIEQLLDEGTSRPTPRRWMRRGHFAPGTRFVYSHLEPDHCLLVRGGAVERLVVRGDDITAPVRRHRMRMPVEAFNWRSLDLEGIA